MMQTHFIHQVHAKKSEILVSLSSGLCIQKDNTAGQAVSFISHKLHFTPLSYNLKAIQQAL